MQTTTESLNNSNDDDESNNNQASSNNDDEGKVEAAVLVASGDEQVVLLNSSTQPPAPPHLSTSEREDSWPPSTGKQVLKPPPQTSSLAPSFDRRFGKLPTGQQDDGSSTPTTSGASVNYAELCYLSNGGSSLTLTVNEATQVGSIIGTVDVSSNLCHFFFFLGVWN